MNKAREKKGKQKALETENIALILAWSVIGRSWFRCFRQSAQVSLMRVTKRMEDQGERAKTRHRILQDYVGGFLRALRKQQPILKML